MFDLEKWREIMSTIQKNRLRTFLTGFSVAWGIFMLIILLGSGTGLKNGVKYGFRDDAINSIWVYSGQTSVPYKGLQSGRNIRFTNDDHNDLARIDGVEHITSRFYLFGSQIVNYKSEYGSFDIRSVHPDHQYLENTIMKEGRFLNEIDIKEFRKVAAIGKLVQDGLFKDESPIGKYININGIPFKVVGTYEDEGGENEMKKVYIPISTAQRIFNGRDRVHQIMMTTGDASVAKSQLMSETIKNKLSSTHRFDPEDERAINVNNNTERFQKVTSVLDAITVFIWAIGIMTIIAGIVGISNIMTIVVKERTREIGIRKAIGATPWSIISLILFESILITGISGYIGLVLGVGLMEGIAAAIPDSEMIRNPTIDIGVAMYATILLVVAGTVAGFFPARRAANIKPIEALREE